MHTADMKHSSFTDHFARVAARYAAHRPTYPPGLFVWLAGQAPSTQLVWDCATGTGQAAVALAEHFSQVQATDASASQIAAASPATGITYAVAPADASGLSDGSADLVTVAQALHWFDLEQFYAEVRRVLKPGGLLAVWTYGVFQVDCSDRQQIQELLDQFYTVTVGPCWPPERRHVENGYADLDFPFESLEVPAFKMSTIWGPDDLAGYLYSWSAVSRYQELHGSDPVAPLMKQLIPLWGDMGRLVVWPLSIKVGKKQ